MNQNVLQECRAAGEVLSEVGRYLENPYSETSPADKPSFPLPDEPHVVAWESYVAHAEQEGAIAALRDRFVQLRFPIEEGISQSEEYRAATKRGRFEAAERYPEGVPFADPGNVTIGVYSTLAGRLPVILAGERVDFEALVRAFSSRNEPEPVPASMGACIVTGFNNWDRVRSYRRNWERDLGRVASEEEWQQEFRGAVIPNKQLYQDRFIILSSGYYSGCSAESLGAEAEEWRTRSIAIRREHEFTHYFTHRVFAQMRNHLHDEVIADFVGLVKATGAYDPALAARFFGLESYPEYRSGGRLENYLGSPPVSRAASKVLQCVVHRSIQNLSAFARGRLERLEDLDYLGEVVFVLARLGLDELAATNAASVMEAQLGEGAEVRESVREITIQLPNSPAALNDLMYGFVGFAEANNLPRRIRRDMHVAFDEVVSNIMRHGYEEGDDYNISVKIKLEEDEIVAEVVDDAKPFNLLDLAPPDGNPAGTTIGGLGVYLVRRLMDDVDYERDGELNRVTLRRRITPFDLSAAVASEGT